MFGFIDTFKVWVMAGGAAIIAVFIAIFKYRGNKIDNLQTEIQVAKNNSEVANKTIKTEKKTSSFEADNKVAAAKVTSKDIDDVEAKFYSI